ncbi:ADYC domain-containing protein [Sorangium sp. So ce185]|uniref:ADYC domain-containing protein n=1 Tax=Sorangium sp. So ce185 TaxID=3133287 RepID=UPI003F63C2F0
MMIGMYALVAGAGCEPGGGEPARAGDPPSLVRPAGFEIIVTNGSSINGPLVNGAARAGTEVYGLGVTGSTADGSAVLGIRLQGSDLTSVRVSDGAVLSGASLAGAVFATQAPGGAPIDLRIDTVSASPSRYHAGSTVSRYTLSYKEGVSGLWRAVCGDVMGVPVAVIPLASRWSYDEGTAGGGAKLDEPDWITFACAGHALHKCVALGYEPWTTAAGAPLGDHHQACVRAYRADYCGDGSPHTTSGQLINLFDDLGVQPDTETWLMESEWDADGARCLSRSRMTGGVAPDCAAGLPVCHSTIGWGDTLVVTEAP